MIFPNLSTLKVALIPGTVETFISRAESLPDQSWKKRAERIIELRKDVYGSAIFSVVSGLFAAVGTNNSLVASRACTVLTIAGIGLTLKATHRIYQAAHDLIYLKKVK